MKSRMMRMVTACLCLAVLAGCATTADVGAGRSERDPFEPMNRAIWGFNEGLDENILRPVAVAYRDAVPRVVRMGVTNFFNNLADVWSSANHLLQGKVEGGLNQGMRVAVNSVFGILGLFDVATEAGLEREPEDLGQTLGVWGLPDGPYLVLPLLGPSSVRDSVGVAADMAVDPVARPGDATVRTSASVVRVINTRSRFLGADRLIDAAALDRYSFVREAYFQRRRNLVYDGNPPDDWDSEEDAEPAQAPAPAPAAK